MGYAQNRQSEPLNLPPAWCTGRQGLWVVLSSVPGLCFPPKLCQSRCGYLGDQPDGESWGDILLLPRDSTWARVRLGRLSVLLLPSLSRC